MISIDEGRIRDHLGELVRGSVEETLNVRCWMLRRMRCGAQRYERSAERTDYRA
ncbi:MAG: hypothetical protein R3F46_01395 [bacterium]